MNDDYIRRDRHPAEPRREHTLARTISVGPRAVVREHGDGFRGPMMRALANVSALSVAFLAGCPPARLDVPCGTSSDCLEAEDGVCLAVADGKQWCTYRDPACASGRIFSDFDVDPMYSGECVPEQPPGGPPTGRCDPTKEFDSPTPVPGFNSLSQELEFTMTSDELFALITRSAPVGQPTILTSTRLTTSGDFPPPMEDPAFAPVVNGEGQEFQPRLSNDGLFLYYSSPPAVRVAQRATRSSPFNGGFQVFLDQSPLSDANEIQLSRDARSLYFTRRFILYSAKRGISSELFESEKQLSTMDTLNIVLSADELTAYYTEVQGTGLYRTTRASKDDPFSPGQLVPSLSDTSEFSLPRFVSDDHCFLYFIRSLSMQSNYDIWVARRGL